MLEKDIEIAIKILYNQSLTQEEREIYGKIYPWSNEALSCYYNYYDLTNKSAFCITSSGDHILYAVDANAKEIDATDLNRLSKYFAALKIACILAYDKNQFDKIFISKTNRIINKKVEIGDLKDYLSDDFFTFWKELKSTKKFKNNINLFRNDGFPRKFNLDYNHLKSKLSNVQINYYDYTAKDFALLKNSENKKYDAIFLSNILEWNRYNDYIIFYDYFNLLNKDGVLYDYHIKSDLHHKNFGTPEKEIIVNTEFGLMKKGVLVYRKK